MEILEVVTNLEQLYVYFAAAALAVTRLVAVMSILPIFTRLGISGILQGGIALALALPILPLIVQAIGPEPLPAGRLAFLLFKEATVGAIIGVVLGVPFWAAEAAGDILDLQRGSSFAGLVDPASTSETTVTGTLLAVAVVALFFTMGGLPLILRTIYDSYGIWPAESFAPLFSANAGLVMLSLLDDVMSMGLMLAVPIVLALLLTDFSLALVSRAAPHMHIFDLSLSVKNLVFALLLVLYSAFLVSYMEMDLRWLLNAKDKLELIRGQPGAILPPR
jgi:type III secretion protein T